MKAVLFSAMPWTLIRIPGKKDKLLLDTVQNEICCMSIKKLRFPAEFFYT